jgi:phosphoribosyl 1,2-cyclic phosphodiesterase
VRLIFLGTRANIDIKSRLHRRHTSTLVAHRRDRIMIDCGADWLRHVRDVRPTAIVITHAHGDHVDGLKHGAPCAVYATTDVWRQIDEWPLQQRRVVLPRRPVKIGRFVFEAIPVRHSLRAPAVAYRIAHGRTHVFYVPDVLKVPRRTDALVDLALYVGDGATVHRPIQRSLGNTLVGHASVRSQVKWCAQAGIPRAIFTHCGTAIVANQDDAERTVAAFGCASGVEASVAYDGLEIRIT